jgi:hypothetical protein
LVEQMDLLNHMDYVAAIVNLSKRFLKDGAQEFEGSSYCTNETKE